MEFSSETVKKSPDGMVTVYKQNKSLVEYTSQQWAVAIKKR